jgi:hypothetical protein
MNPAAVFVMHTGTPKLGFAACTYVSVEHTCPRSCGLRDAGCYAQTARGVGFTVRRLDARHVTPLQAACAEASAILENAPHAPPGHPLRLHVAGDCRTRRAAETVSDACRSWRGPVWTYTHAWRTVPRAAWGGVSVLASIEDARDGRAALRAGYAPALVVAEHPRNGRAWKHYGVTWIPCPEQTRGVKCSACRLCFDAEALRARKSGIAFAAHGNGRATVKRNLRQLPLFQGGA